MSNPAPPDLFGAEDFAKAANVSRETLARLKAYVGLLEDWNARHNLVSEASLADVWKRHIWDSAQLAPLIPENAKTLIDLGSGAGFPGLVLAVMLRDRLKVTLVDSIAKKTQFLEAAAERMGLAVTIRNTRIEAGETERFDVVTARALAPLDKLLGYAQHFAGPRTVCLLPKGQNLADELTLARENWRMTVSQHPSLTHPLGTILEIRGLVHVAKR